MKKLLTIIGIIIIVGVISGNTVNNSYHNVKCSIYYADHSMMRLIPIEYDCGYSSTSGAAKKVIKKLIDGADSNSKILRVIPANKGCMSVKVKDTTAYVDLKKEFIQNKPENRNLELLAIYSVVNSLTSIKGIDTVKFTVEGEDKKECIGGIDMRETLIPDYYI